MSTVQMPSHVQALTADSRQVRAGSAFLAYPGPHSDGRDYIEQAIAQGAALVLWEPAQFEWQARWQVMQTAVPGLQMQAGHIASAFYQHPSHAMWCIGVTGTNGKTTVSHWLAQAYAYLQQPVAVMGTLGNGPLDQLQASLNTTLGAIDCQKQLAQMRDTHTQVVAMEVSSHGLDQGRVNGVAFDVAIFTNLTRDHLDYHHTMAAYQAAKRKLFDWSSLRVSIVNVDDTVGLALYQELTTLSRPVLSYGLHTGDIHAKHITSLATGFQLDVVTPQGEGVVTLHALGAFNISNAFAVLASLLAHTIPLPLALEAISQLRPVQGRMQMLGGGDAPLVVVDYAHTPDALSQALTTLRAQTAGHITCVFGCGGDRDPGKRAEMGAIASRLADELMLTTDNPRFEAPEHIINMILAGVSAPYTYQADRAQAITQAIQQAHIGDVVLVAGKGHEPYQEVQGVRYAFSDVECVQAALVAYAAAKGVQS